MPTNVIVTKDGTVATLTLKSEDGLNVLSRASLGALHEQLDALSHETALRALVITGAGARAFSAGADLRELAELDHESARAYSIYGQMITQELSRFPLPTFAALNGPAYGGGIELALACDFRLGSATSTLHYQASKLGLLPGWGGTQRLPGLIGASRAKAMMLMSRPVAPAQALAWGLIDELADPADMAALVENWVAGLDVAAMVQIKRAIDLVGVHDFVGEQAAFAACFVNGRAARLVRAWLDRGTRPTPSETTPS